MPNLTHQQIWRHNSFIGLAAAMKKHLTSMFEAESTTEHTKRLAAAIASDIEVLEESLKTRSDTEQ